MTLACEDVRVIDLSSGRVGGIATMVLADYGADVIKVEASTGDPAREREPSWPMWLRGKRSVALDLTQVADQAKLHDLVRTADVVVASYGPGAAEAHKADYATLSALNPGLIYCSATTWGLNGPYANYPSHDEALVAAKAGRFWAFQNLTRRPGPSFAAVQVGTHGASLSAAAGILAALHARKRTGVGQMLETSVLQGLLPFENTLIREQMEARYPEKMATERGPQNTPNAMSSLGYQPVMAKDGQWIQFANLMEHLFQASIVSLGLIEEVLANPEYSGAPNGLTEDKREEVRNIMLNRAQEKTAAEWMEIFYGNEDVAADYVETAQDALHHRDLVANGEVVEYDHPTVGKLRMAGPLGTLRGTPGRAGGPAPMPGQHTQEVLAAPRQAAALKGTGDTKPPLDGITVLEFATIIATPLGCSLLGDLGARVIKVEPIGGDPGRGLARASGIGSYIGASRNNSTKESICIDLKSEHGQAIVRDLIKQADFIIHNYRPGVPERLGIGYEQAKAIKDDIIWINLNGYGPDGPGYLHPGAHPIPGAVNGGALMQAGANWPGDTSTLDGIREASRRFTRANESNPDPCSAMGLQATALLALRARDITGKGQQAFVSMVGSNAYANSDDSLSYPGKPARPVLDEWVMGVGPLRRLYHAQDEQWAFLSAEDDASFARFCATAGRADLAGDARYANATARAQHADELTAALEPLFLTKTADAWEQTLIAANVGCVRADGYKNSGQFWLNDPQPKANGLTPTAHHLVMGDYQRWGPVVKFSHNPGHYGGGMLAGEHTDALLAELGFTSEAISDLRARKVVWSEEAVYP
jgi:crotonobetainyl-CoA:carnitine CoA-transferase CaiB-like acyl-CoA transferase